MIRTSLFELHEALEDQEACFQRGTHYVVTPTSPTEVMIKTLAAESAGATVAIASPQWPESWQRLWAKYCSISLRRNNHLN